MTVQAKGEVLVPGAPGQGPALVLQAPISFWGGVDPRDGRIIDVRHPQHGAVVAAKVLFVPATIGSSSASSVLLELVRAGVAPAALIIGEADAILLLGLVVAREMGWEPPVAVRLDPEQFSAFSDRIVTVANDGTLQALDDQS
ncbi:DUF126 domain-containing protein [Nitratireductor sp. StC3]|uniref:aconitase X swivel domain-containing protein n=1 Tax=Nitratireductor sp. StC3 TaxID=2126741 RepID=UPI001FDF9116|nr:DUF126 domain-containing protein [Nitratireductor sp. StC3]